MTRKDVMTELALLLAGGLVAACVVVRRKPRKAPSADATSADATSLSDFRRAFVELETRLADEASATANRFAELEARVDEQSAKLANIPETKQLVAAVESALARALAPIEQRLTAQAEAIGTLKSAAGQTDTVLERIFDMTKETLSQRRSV